MKIRDLKIEYRKNPIGLDEVNPRFSWKIESNEKDVVQDAYEIKVYKNSEPRDWLDLTQNSCSEISDLILVLMLL